MVDEIGESRGRFDGVEVGLGDRLLLEPLAEAGARDTGVAGAVPLGGGFRFLVEVKRAMAWSYSETVPTGLFGVVGEALLASG